VVLVVRCLARAGDLGCGRPVLGHTNAEESPALRRGQMRDSQADMAFSADSDDIGLRAYAVRPGVKRQVLVTGVERYEAVTRTWRTGAKLGQFHIVRSK